jgi:hypothetical protein
MAQPFLGEAISAQNVRHNTFHYFGFGLIIVGGDTGQAEHRFGLTESQVNNLYPQAQLAFA